jgi:hypothetical protein
MFYFFQVYYKNEDEILQIKKLRDDGIEKKLNFINYFK